jgi:hypothetical protein
VRSREHRFKESSPLGQVSIKLCQHCLFLPLFF